MVKAETVKEGSSSSAPQQHSTEVLHQRKKMPRCPMKMAIGGFAAISVLGYLVLYSNKKPEASAVDVAKVASGMANPDNTRPRN
ncbi:hypothetical protein LR48_Vigan01g243600 [Vigna angularis]|uniref:Transmembrane protein n=2 Tax=Phaseolus angularis TaxID=3914 RepID=A0A0L9TQQ0_PHAAN|nr:hypothetical protein LR48_Vigan01g243600 [Vigna angularis]BAT76173.1 hypothetical protein VIGAN_01414000 [Vigna angularis var. angularis]